MRVLLVDDDADVLHTLGRLLGAFGLDVLTCSACEDALRHAKGGGFDAVVTDWLMPGNQQLELVHSLVAALPRLPVVVTTGGGDALPTVLSERRVTLMRKPIHARELVARLEALVASSSTV